MKLTLIKTERLPVSKANVRKMEDHYTYQSDDGRVCTFCAHPTREWNFIIKNSTLTGAELEDLIEAWTTQGVNQHKYASFDDAIQVLEI